MFRRGPPPSHGDVECRSDRQKSRSQPIYSSIACCEWFDRQMQYTQLWRTVPWQVDNTIVTGITAAEFVALLHMTNAHKHVAYEMRAHNKAWKTQQKQASKQKNLYNSLHLCVISSLLRIQSWTQSCFTHWQRQTGLIEKRCI